MTEPYGKGGYGTVLPWGSVEFPTPSVPSSTAGDIEPLGILEATVGAIAEEDNEIGGFIMTRLVGNHTAGSTTLNVESTLDWPEDGKIGIGGILYYYTGKTDTTLTGISHIADGSSVAGLAVDHNSDSSVIDVSLQRSTLERLRRSFLVEYAEGEDLKVVGRNIGVNYLPLFGDDDKFREIIKVMAYNPKGTVHGLELALTGLVGAGNFEIYEDLIMHPCTVFFKIDQSVLTDNVSAGKTYLTGHAWDYLAGSQNALSLSAAPTTVQSVTLKDLGEEFDFRNDRPSALTYAYFEGETPAGAWDWAGSDTENTGTEGTSASWVVAGSHTRLKSINASGTAYYRMPDTKGARITEDSHVEVSTTMQIPTGAGLSAGKLLQASISLFDGAYIVRAGIESDRSFGLFATEGGGHLGSTVTLAFDQFYDVTIRKYADDRVDLYVDGQLVDTQNYSAFTASTTNHRIEFGIDGTPAINMEVWFREFNAHITNRIDYWSARENGTGTVSIADPVRFILSGSSYTFIGADVGKGLRIFGAANKKNNGDWEIASFSGGTEVDLIGPTHEESASVSISNPTRITVDMPNSFKYPDDIGKKIVISGSGLGNDGTYTISKLLQEGTFTDFSTFLTPGKEEYTTICEVSSATFVTEDNLDWYFKPDFATETGLDWGQADAGSVSGSNLTLRQALWANNLVMEISYSDVLTAQLLKDTDVGNLVIQTTPDVLYEYYPFYLADPLGELVAYLDTITAAGVIPEISMEE